MFQERETKAGEIIGIILITLVECRVNDIVLGRNVITIFEFLEHFAKMEWVVHFEAASNRTG